MFSELNRMNAHAMLKSALRAVARYSGIDRMLALRYGGRRELFSTWAVKK
jgi:hypothetical protein